MRFLSCLFGSEGTPCPSIRTTLFLSCLFGSEGAVRALVALLVFLSCLFGSEELDARLVVNYAVSKLPIRQ